MAYELLEELLPLIRQFEEEQGGDSPQAQSFSHWMTRRFRQDNSPLPPPNPRLKGLISQHIGMLYKHAKSYIKKAFEGSSLSSVDDFSYLATLWQEGSMRKTELIQFNVGEVSSGMEVIKRLSRRGFILDFPDPEDKRSRRVDLSEEGEQELLRVMQKMHVVSDIVVGNLTEVETHTLFALLDKLSHHHRRIYHESREDGLEEIRQQYRLSED